MKTITSALALATALVLAGCGASQEAAPTDAPATGKTMPAPKTPTDATAGKTPEAPAAPGPMTYSLSVEGMT